jgi:hypothetical protein
VVYLSAGTVPVAHSLYLGLLAASDFRLSQAESCVEATWLREWTEHADTVGLSVGLR